MFEQSCYVLVFLCCCNPQFLNLLVFWNVLSRGGYESAAKYFVAEDLQVDVKEKSYMITGANSGIGKAAALAIAKRGKVQTSPVISLLRAEGRISSFSPLQ